MFKVPEQYRIMGTPGSLSGSFQFLKNRIYYRIIASNEHSWEHVSVSLDKKRTPDWEEMCMIKDLFWDEDDTVIQYHPAKKDYVNFHPYVLHMWRPISIQLPTPPIIMV
jgi:hypothetical protein